MQSSQPTPQADDVTQMDACPVCGSSVGAWRSKETPYGVFLIDRCSGCGFAFVNPRPSLDYLIEFYGHFGEEGAPPMPEDVLAPGHRTSLRADSDAAQQEDVLGNRIRLILGHKRQVPGLPFRMP